MNFQEVLAREFCTLLVFPVSLVKKEKRIAFYTIRENLQYIAYLKGA